MSQVSKKTAKKDNTQKQKGGNKKADDFEATPIQSDKLLTVDNFQKIISDFWEGYQKDTPKKIRLIDSFLAFCFVFMMIQMGYFVFVGDFPRNALLSGLFAPGGTLIITLCLRLQLFKNAEERYLKISNERAIWEYLFCILLLFLATVLFVG